MSATPHLHLYPIVRGEAAFAPDATAVGAAQRAGLGRGLVFVLLLAASLLGSVYVPQAFTGPDWAEGHRPAPSP